MTSSAERTLAPMLDLIEISMRGKTNAEIARDTGLSPSTVARYRKKDVMYPRFQVLFELMHYAGYLIVFRKPEDNIMPIRLVK